MAKKLQLSTTISKSHFAVLERLQHTSYRGEKINLSKSEVLELIIETLCHCEVVEGPVLGFEIKCKKGQENYLREDI